jgi:ribonuclease III
MTTVERERGLQREQVLQRLARLLGLANLDSIDRLPEALSHPSRSHEVGGPDNQRLEFLGDAVLGLAMSQELMRLFEEADEGKLTRLRSALVNATALAAWANEIELSHALEMGKGARAAKEHLRVNVLADAVEAVFAAVYLAHGIDGVMPLVRDVLRVNRDALEEGEDPKSALQILVQSAGFPSPEYQVIATVGPEHAATFTIVASVGGIEFGRGSGSSKKDAARRAATDSLRQGAERILATLTSTTHASSNDR